VPAGQRVGKSDGDLRCTVLDGLAVALAARGEHTGQRERPGDRSDDAGARTS
jgi:hypothetical protein